ncbi:hypothetical protein AM588_10009944 [Phytophthora nicotianae]|uniref:Uncharacterized protein n=1 Tax=Phytophthora nicotianae TaxID=4792 RepID=A0A0W8DTI2_PHYNI|nr:hypothetical protein AM588_10009944 [Phytophthora nicotianae]
MATDQEETEEDREKRAKYLARRRQKLLRLDEEMRYDSMVRNVKTQSAAKELAHHQTSVRQHLSIGANMVMARVTAFIAVYFLARNLTENETTVSFEAEVLKSKFESIEHEHKKHKSVF